LVQVSKTGQTITVASRWTLMLDETGVPKAMLVVNTDITEKKQLEAQFLRVQRMESIGTLGKRHCPRFKQHLDPHFVFGTIAADAKHAD
jgi:hypothetical protein